MTMMYGVQLLVAFKSLNNEPILICFSFRPGHVTTFILIVESALSDFYVLYWEVQHLVFANSPVFSHPLLSKRKSKVKKIGLFQLETVQRASRCDKREDLI